MFKKTSSYFSKLFSSIKSKEFTDQEINLMLVDIRNILIESDAPFEYAKKITETFKERIKSERFKTADKKNLIIQGLFKHIGEFLFSEPKAIRLNSGLTKMCVLGTNGVGKTSFLIKFAKILKNRGLSVACVSFDKIRPAAQTQLDILCKQEGIHYYDLSNDDFRSNIDIVKSIEESGNYRILLVDMPGINHNNIESTKYLNDIEKNLNFDEEFLVLDSTFAGSSSNIIETFIKLFNITGIVVSKMDTDNNGGIFFSVNYVTKLPIRYVTFGEKITDIEKYNSSKITEEILGKKQLGEFKEFTTKNEHNINGNIKNMINKLIGNNSMDFNDLLQYFNVMNKIDSFGSKIKFIPIFNNLTKKIKDLETQKEIKKVIAIINSMTKEERENPSLVLEKKRAERIANGSGFKIENVIDAYNKLKLIDQEITQKMPKGIVEQLKNANL